MDDFAEAVRTLTIRQRRRALVVLLTNLRGEDAPDLLPAIRLLRRSHLVLIANLREASVDALDDTPIGDLPAALTHCAGVAYREQRSELMAQLSSAKAITIDEPAGDLPVALANRYLQIKASGEL